MYGYAVMMLIFPLLAGLSFVHASRFAIQVQVRVRAQLTAAVYHKALRLSTRCAPCNVLLSSPPRGGQGAQETWEEG